MDKRAAGGARDRAGLTRLTLAGLDIQAVSMSLGAWTHPGVQCGARASGETPDARTATLAA